MLSASNRSSQSSQPSPSPNTDIVAPSTASEESLVRPPKPPTPDSDSNAVTDAQPEPPARPPQSPTPDLDSNAAMDTQPETPARPHPIPPPSEPKQYRAIGIVRGKYAPADPEQLTQGTLVASDGAEIDAVLLGRTIGLVKNHIDLDREHLWVVYPRNNQKKEDEENNNRLHVQIVGVWEPENLSEAYRDSDDGGDTDTDTDELLPYSSDEVDDNFFSIRGEAIFHDRDNDYVVIKIKRAPRKAGDKPKAFKLKLKAQLSGRVVNRFWDFRVRRENDELTVFESEDIGAMPVQPKKKGGFKGRGGPKGPKGTKKPFPRRSRSDEDFKPDRPSGSATARPSVPKPKPKPRPSRSSE